MAYMYEMYLQKSTNIAVWGTGKNGKPWIRLLIDNGFTPLLFDAFGKAQYRGINIHRPDKLKMLKPDLLIVAVGARGARSQIRQFIVDNVPHLIEGKNWFAVA
jgi:hypothetical protein